MDIFIEPMDYDSIDELASLYVKIYKKVKKKKKWSIISAKKFIKYFYELCPEGKRAGNGHPSPFTATDTAAPAHPRTSRCPSGHGPAPHHSC